MDATKQVPWTPREWSEQVERDYEGNIVIVSNGSHLVALVPPIDCDRDPNDVYEGNETRANARLLRAAPELVTALDALCDFTDDGTDPGPELRYARALLARIRGTP